MSNLISAIVLTYNSYSTKSGCVEHTLLALLNQEGVNKEIVVVDNSTLKEDSHKLTAFCANYPGKITILKRDLPVAKARNAGAEAAQGDLFLFVDDDTIALEDRALEKIINASKTATHGYGANRLWTPPEEWFAEHSEQIKRELTARNYTNLKRQCGRPHISIRRKNDERLLMKSFIGNFGFVRRDLFFSVEGFPSSFTGYSAEDDVLQFMCYIHSSPPAILNDIEVVHVTHPINSASLEEACVNYRLYKEVIRSHGYSSFHIIDLLFPHQALNRPILEKC